MKKGDAGQKKGGRNEFTPDYWFRPPFLHVRFRSHRRGLRSASYTPAPGLAGLKNPVPIGTRCPCYQSHVSNHRSEGIIHAC